MIISPLIKSVHTFSQPSTVVQHRPLGCAGKAQCSQSQRFSHPPSLPPCSGGQMTSLQWPSKQDLTCLEPVFHDMSPKYSSCTGGLLTSTAAKTAHNTTTLEKVGSLTSDKTVRATQPLERMSFQNLVI